MNISIKIKLFSSLLLFLMTTSLSYAINVAGKTMIARGQVQATSSGSSNIRPLKRRSEIFQNEVVTTGAGSKTQLRMVDGGMIALKENTELIIADYQLKANEEKGSVVLELVQGGLRSITGTIKGDEGGYQLKTPIASIGIRGTHYEVELSGGELFIAVWDGAIDISNEIGSRGQDVSLGEGEDYSYAKIGKTGEVFELLEPPQSFNEGHSSDPQDDPEEAADQEPVEDETEQSSDSDSDSDSGSGEGGQVAEAANEEGEEVAAEASIPSEEEAELVASEVSVASEDADTQTIEDIIFDVQPVSDELQSQGAQSIYDLVATREGSLTYGDASFTSKDNLSDFSLGMEINFDSGEISNGQLSFNDDQNNGKWNAVFNGNVNLTRDNVFLEVDITSASHGNNIADGDISAQFVDSLGLDSVIGDFELHDVEGDASVGASYQVKGQ